MSYSNRRRILSIALFLALGGAPLIAAGPDLGGVSRSGWSSLWELTVGRLDALKASWASCEGKKPLLSRKHGGCIDPDGKPVSCPKHGCGIDPNGREVSCPKHGGCIDPDGKPIHCP